MRHGSPPRLMALQSILSPNRRESLPTPSAGVRIKPEESENVKALIEQAAELIPAAVRSIDRFFKQPRPSFEGGTKVGRNDPCVCGSGKKFKKCCGRH
jgi:uncharacterized protein YecA (UPF0149 family)